MADQGFVLIDSKAFDAAIAQRQAIMESYARLTNDFDSAVASLSANWQGKGADAFFQDVKMVRSNITAIFDVLITMCDTIEDCRKVIGDHDASLGSTNREAAAQKN